MWEFLIRSLDASTIFTIAALGELIGQRSGVLNVGIEGVMLFRRHLGFHHSANHRQLPARLPGRNCDWGLVRTSARFLFHYAGRRSGRERDGDLDPGVRPHHLSSAAHLQDLWEWERIPSVFGLSPFFFIGLVLVVTHLVRALQDELGSEDQIGGREPRSG